MRTISRITFGFNSEKKLTATVVDAEGNRLAAIGANALLETVRSSGYQVYAQPRKILLVRPERIAANHGNRELVVTDYYTERLDLDIERFGTAASVTVSGKAPLAEEASSEGKAFLAGLTVLPIRERKAAVQAAETTDLAD